MVDDDVDRHLGLDRGRVAASVRDSIAQSGDVDQHHLAQDVLSENPVWKHREPGANAPVREIVDFGCQLALGLFTIGVTCAWGSVLYRRLWVERGALDGNGGETIDV